MVDTEIQLQKYRDTIAEIYWCMVTQIQKYTDTLVVSHEKIHTDTDSKYTHMRYRFLVAYQMLYTET